MKGQSHDKYPASEVPILRLIGYREGFLDRRDIPGYNNLPKGDREVTDINPPLLTDLSRFSTDLSAAASFVADPEKTGKLRPLWSRKMRKMSDPAFSRSYTTWGRSDSPCIVTEGVAVMDGVTLTIEAGVMETFSLIPSNPSTVRKVLREERKMGHG